MRTNKPHGNFLTVYRASAGSGKTYTLAAEYIAKLLQQPVAAHRGILAVTFTNKATAEMKNRILARLYDLSEGQDEGFAGRVMSLMHDVSEDELRRRARAALEAIVHDYDGFQVQTIDRFFQRMLTALARELGLSAGYRTSINDAEVASAAVDDLLDGLAHDGDTVLLRLLSDYVRKTMDEGDGWGIRERIKAFARRNALSDAFQADKDEYMAFLNDEEGVRAFYADVLGRLRATAPEGEMWKDVTMIAGQLYDRLVSMNVGKLYDKGMSLTKYLQRLAEGNFKAPAERVRGFMGFPESLVHEKARDDAAAREAACGLMAEVNALQQRIDSLIYTRNSALLTLQTFNDLRLLGRISQKIDDINRAEGRFLLSRTKWLFSQMVRSSDAPFVFEKMGTRLHHIMIDEFQDTARTQWNNIRSLLLEKISAGESCLIVGDVKQSIYRFNGGDWRILSDMENEAGVPINSVTLKENFRSQRRIVGFNNLFFTTAAAIMDKLGDTDMLGKLYNNEDTIQHCHRRTDNGYVRATIISEKGRTALSEDHDSSDAPLSLYACIIQLHEQGIPYKDMAILVRWNSEAEKIVNHFSVFHPEIPLVSQEAFMLSASPAVMTIVSALRWLIAPDDTVALTYCCNVYQNLIMQRDIAIGLICEELGKYAPLEFMKKRETLLKMPLYECALSICQMFNFDRLDESPSMQGQGIFLGSFFDEILSFLNDTNGDIRTFLHHWDETLSEKKIPTAETNGINIVTIHKSKGLAYDTVLVPFCDWDIENPRVTSDAYIWAKGAEKPYSKLPPYPVKEKKDMGQSTYHADYHTELIQRRVDNLNMFYVAFTRAKSNLLFWSSSTGLATKVNNTFTIGNLVSHTFDEILSRNSEEFLLHQNLYDEANATVFSYGEPYCSATVAVNGDSEEHKEYNPLNYESVALPLKIETNKCRAVFMQSSEARQLVSSTEEDDVQGDEYIRRGNMLHYIMSMIHYADDIAQAIAKAKAEGLLGAGMEEEKIRKFVSDRINDNRTRGWFTHDWAIHNESEIVSHSAGVTVVKRPDRVMTQGNRAIVVDYKFGKPHAIHRDQVRGYIQLLHTMGYEDVKGYIWYMYTNRIEDAN